MTSPFDEALSDLRISGVVLLHESYAPPWAIDIPDAGSLRVALGAGRDERVVPFHLVRRGAFDLRYADRDPERIETCEVAICPSGAPHRMSFGDGAKAVPMTEALARSDRMAAAGPDATELICGVFRLRSAPRNPLLSALPRVMKVRASGTGTDPLLAHATAMLGIAVDRGRASFVAARLLEIFFAEAIRAYATTEGAASTGWFKALGDPKIAAVLSRLHERPGEPWTVTSLAAGIAMSPSRFAARFREVMGESPMAYVSSWRMSVACRRLRDMDEPLGTIAEAVGYQDVASFSRAFKSVVGESPARWRSARTRPVSLANRV